MAIERQQNWLGQQRVDLPHLRSIESAVTADFDVAVGNVATGQQALIIRGFTISTANAIGALPRTLQLVVAGAILANVNASESGTLFQSPSSRAAEVLDTTLNAKVFGTFTNNRANYVGLDLLRSADDTTADLVEFLNADTDLESPEIVPLARTLDYRIVISTSDFGSQPNVTPIAIVTTSASGAVTAIQDARNTPFRLGSGGTLPNRFNTYSWPYGRSENTTGSVFVGGDKGISSQWEWGQSVMTRLWEIGGGQYWYSPAANRDVRLVRNLSSRFSNGDNFEIVSSNLFWAGLRLVFANALGIAGDSYQGLPIYYNDIQDQVSPVVGLTDLVDGQCLYVDLDQTTLHDNTLTAPNLGLIMQKGTMATLGTPLIPGSRFIIAWATQGNIYTRDDQFPVGTILTPATTSSTGVVAVNVAPASSTFPIAASADGSGNAIAAGLSRGNGSAPHFSSGALSIGGGSNDTSIGIGGGTTSQFIAINTAPNGGTTRTSILGNTISIGGTIVGQFVSSITLETTTTGSSISIVPTVNDATSTISIGNTSFTGTVTIGGNLSNRPAAINIDGAAVNIGTSTFNGQLVTIGSNNGSTSVIFPGAAANGYFLIPAGGTQQIPDFCPKFCINTHTGNVTVQLPANPFDGQEVIVMNRNGTITTIQSGGVSMTATINDGSGATGVSGPGTYASKKFKYIASLTGWYTY